MAAWNRLKKRVGQLNSGECRAPIYRTKVGCLRVCTDGPTAVVYPEGTWYAGLRPANLERMIDGDLREGHAVDDLVIGRNPLPAEQ